MRDFVAVTKPGRAESIGTLAGIAALLALAAVLVPFRAGTSRAVPALVFVLPVVAAAIVGQRRAAVVTGLAAALVFSFAFVPPYDRMSIAVADDWVALAVFLVVALVVGTLVATEAERRRAAEQRADELTRLYRRNQALVAERNLLQEDANRVALMERVDEQRAALLRSVSHDLRTPLATIRAVTSDLRDEAAFDEATRHQLLDLVGDEADRLDRIVGNLLSLSRIEAGALRPDCQAVALDELLADRIKQLGRLFGPKNVAVAIDAPAELPLVEADYVQLDLVISNLLENAARHTPPGSTIRVRARPAGDLMEVTVSDEGAGVPVEERDRIFEPFRSGAPSPSSGVGLAICKAIVEAHGGTIELEGTKAGASFRFSVPLSHDHD